MFRLSGMLLAQSGESKYLRMNSSLERERRQRGFRPFTRLHLLQLRRRIESARLKSPRKVHSACILLLFFSIAALIIAVDSKSEDEKC